MIKEEILKYSFFGMILIAVILEAVADIFFKKWAVDSKNMLLFVGLFIYFIGTVIWAFSLKYGYLSKAISIFTVLNLVIIVGVGVMYFGETLTSINKIGIVLGIISVILMQI